MLTGRKIRVRVYRNPLKQMYKLKLFMGTKSMELIVTPTSVFCDANNVIAVWPTSKLLFDALYYHDKNKLQTLLPTLLETAKLLA
jgi:hypothetical protein